MNFKPILLVAGEPNSIFLEIFFKIDKIKKIKSPLILIGSNKVLNLQMKKFNFNKKIRLIDPRIIDTYKLNNKTINIIDVKYNTKKTFEKITVKSRSYIDNCFQVAMNIINTGFTKKLINGPVSKKNFLGKKYPGVTEYLASKYNKKKFAMLIYNKNLSVCPITTHLPLKNVAKKIKKKTIIEKVLLINDFFKTHFKIKPRIAITGLNPHCENFTDTNEDNEILKPTVNYLYKSGLKVFGPFPADTIFTKNNRKKYDVIVGMYHDQVLTPMKTLYEYDAINITLGLPFLRISPDHGPNVSMLGKNLSNPLSLIKAINFLDKIK
tara:strand:- start:1509 stop:2477 length:969 start_codon:yes stop_codon:yes gene_type:complete